MSEPFRPDPDALLPLAQREGRGRLKIFLGAAPGVGKTFAMLEAAKARQAEGLAVLVGVVETHGRAETEAMLRGLDVLPRRSALYNGRILQEMDVEALIARRPALALIDELAHSNLAGGRHEKRWQDVEDVLAAGIDVYTTLNVQHVETLNDTVARITGVRVRETVPDQVLAIADEIELIDLPPDDLIARLRAGKVYVEDQAARAVGNFFAKGNLTALRELAMRTAADRVEAQLQEHMATHAIAGPWPTQERILVVLPEGAVGRDAIRIGKRSADRARVEWLALGLTSLKSEAHHGAAAQNIPALRLAERLGAEVSVLQDDGHGATEILDFARRHNVLRIVVPRPRPRARLWQWLAPHPQERLVAALTQQAVQYELTLVRDDESPARQRQRGPLLPPRPSPQAVLIVVATVLVTTLLALTAERLIPVLSLSLLYMTAVVAIAAKMGLRASVLTAALSFFAYNYVFTSPRFTLHIWYRGEVATLVLFMLASVLTGNLTARLRDRAIAQRAIADRTRQLYDFSRRAASAASFDDMVWAAVSHVATVLECETILLTPDEAGEGLAIRGAFPPEDRMAPRELSAARYAFDHGEAAGRGSGTLPASRWLFLPLMAGGRKLGALGIAWADGREALPSDRRLLEALCDQLALALERIRLSEDLSQSRVVSEAERLRTALLSSVSHDLRTPLVSVLGAAERLGQPGLTPQASRELVETIREEAERLDRYIQNLLDMTRLGHGALRPNAQACDLAELIGVARGRLRGVLQRLQITTDLPDDLPLLRVDPILIEQVLVNILDNARKYAGPEARIWISATPQHGMAHIVIEDDGPGLPEADAAQVFDMFWRAAQGDGGQAGTGLGLAICKGLVEAHGGAISAESARGDGRGLRIVMELPLAP